VTTQTVQDPIAAPADRARRFPWHAMERLTAWEVAALRGVRRWAAAHANVEGLGAELGQLLSTPVQILLQNIRSARSARGIAGGAAVLIARADRPELGRAMLVEVDSLLGTLAAMRVSRGRSVKPAAVPGAVGALVMAALRSAHSSIALRVLSAGPSAELEVDLARAHAELVAVTLTMLVGDDAYEARLVVPTTLVAEASASCLPTWNATVLRALGATPLSVPVVADAARVTALDVAELQQGDAWMLGRQTLLGQPVVLAPEGAEMGISAVLTAEGRLELGAAVVPVCPKDEQKEAQMSEAGGGVVDTLGQVPVVMRVEIGEVRMAARDWATVSKGDVVTLDQRVGAPVTLRVGGVPVARGDLVDIDGEIGVRIIERMSP
jgi:type III secretion protein Q